MADKAGRKYDINEPTLAVLERSVAQKAHFFLEGKLYKMLRQDRAADLMTAWDFQEEKMAQFVLSDAKRRMKSAYDTVEVAQLLNRTRSTVQGYVNKGKINSPVRIHEKGKNIYGKPFSKMKWSEDDILALHDYLTGAGGGRPRNNGTLYPAARLPNRRELLALMRQQPLFYMKTAQGEMVPVWSAYNEV